MSTECSLLHGIVWHIWFVFEMTSVDQARMKQYSAQAKAQQPAAVHVVLQQGMIAPDRIALSSAILTGLLTIRTQMDCE